MSSSYSIAAAKDQFPKLVHEAEGGSPVEITRRGRRVAVLLSTDLYARLAGESHSLWKGICELREAYRVAEIEDDGALEGLRDPRPGRDVSL